ncbi:Bacterial low temperature requirement A protein (LtrA) [Planctomycetes bacterium Pla86]|uniref:Bacterial low temperature requirement A protein (LtrA) n=2 Tax=Engelhardtia mirabilis TaxID=2528011 RepID=A0A518BS73_9BACT|nr:Bacterial low temperature requirement A protein (LtrA) [Planctomycetes bacterium Pla133]QDV04141.1 Bacterial low temperature requirement A protein (LtrA) [Planctomycetes bacterium Pla86]
MVPRKPDELHRAATPLELLYDLCFVVAIAQAAQSLHHALAHGEGWHALVPFGMVFFAIWWAWMGFTWFASAYDTDDVPYRLKVLLQMFGLLVLAAGVPRAFEHQDFRFMVVGYAIMRVGLVAQWLRAARSDRGRRSTALRYATGISVLQVAWIGMLALPAQWQATVWLLLVPAELGVPVWAERAGATSWHPHHITERYGLMTIIVIGESVLAATVAIQTALDAGAFSAALVAVILSAPVILFAMWWLYFQRPAVAAERTNWKAIAWGYGHYFVFAAAAATGTGLAVVVDHAAHSAHISSLAASLTLAIPVALYVISLALNHMRCGDGGWRHFLIALLCLGTAWLPLGPVWIAAALALLTAIEVVDENRRAIQQDGAAA